MAILSNSALVTLADLENETLVGFYTHLLGKPPHPYFPKVYAEFQLPGLRIGIFKPKESHVAEFATQGKTGISLCFEVEDLESAIAYLTELGYPPGGEIITASHGREIYAYDPAGNRLILHQSPRDTNNIK
jgi:predicted enzyme related to lactoylglutathione lyase